MSRFAGAVSGRKVVQGTTANHLPKGKIVVVGGGVAGKSAIAEMIRQMAHLIVIEPWEPMRVKLATELPVLGVPVDRFEIRPALGDEALEGAIGVVFAHRTGARAAEKVCDETQIRKMKKGGVIADIAIDQGGSIRHEGYDEADSADVARRKYLSLFEGDYVYYGEVNMPREEPHLASIHRGAALRHAAPRPVRSARRTRGGGVAAAGVDAQDVRP
jgi:alanine dehydrogenase